MNVSSCLSTNIWTVNSVDGIIARTAPDTLYTPQQQCRNASWGQIAMQLSWPIPTGQWSRKLSRIVVLFLERRLRVCAVAIAFFCCGCAVHGQNPELVIETQHKSYVSEVAFTPDSRTLASTGGGTVKLWDVATGLQLRTLNLNTEDPAFSPDGRILAAAEDREISLWDPVTGKKIGSLRSSKPMVLSLAWSRTGMLATAASDYHDIEEATISIWDVAARREVHSIKLHHGPIRALAFSPDGRILASGSGGDDIILWDVEKGEPIRTLSGHTSEVTTLSFSASSRVLVSGSKDNTIRLWEVASRKPKRTIDTTNNSQRRDSDINPKGIASVSISPDGKLIASVGENNTVKVWDASTGKEIKTLALGQHDFYLRPTKDTHEEEIVGGKEVSSFVTFSPDGNWLAATSGWGMKVWRTGDWNTPREFLGQTAAFLTARAVSPDGQWIAAATEWGEVKLWNANAGTDQLRTFQTFKLLAARSIAFSPNSRILAAATELKPRPGVAPPAVNSVAGVSSSSHNGATSDIGCSNPHNVEAGGSTSDNGDDGGAIKLWDVATGSELWELPWGGDELAFSPDGRLLASAYSMFAESTITIWDLTTHKALTTLTSENSPVQSIAFSPDGRVFVAGGACKMIDVWKVAGWKRMPPLTGSVGGVWYLAFSPDDRLLVSGGGDQTARIWNVASGEPRSVLTTAQEEASPLAFSMPDGKYLAVGSTLWEISTAKARELTDTERATPAISSLTFSADGQSYGPHAYVSLHDTWLGLQKIADGKQVGKLYAIDPNDWAVVDPEGRFDGSPGGLALMHYVVAKQCGTGEPALEAMDLAQLKNRYYDPGLLAKVFGFKKEPLRNVSAFDHVDLYPDVATAGSADTEGKFNIHLINCGGGIGQVQVFVNGKPFVADARGSHPEPSAKETTIRVDLKAAPLIPGQRNEIRVVAWNAEHYVHSRGTIVEYFPGSGVSAKGGEGNIPTVASGTGGRSYHPDLYAIVAGISNYSNPQLQLNFSSKDAESMATAIQLAGDRLFGCGHVHIYLFSSRDQAPPGVPCTIGPSVAADELVWARPTKVDIQRAFETAKKSQPWDVLVVYFSGHGVAFGDTYAYPTEDANTIHPNDLSNDSQLLAQTAITSGELAEWMGRDIPATHEVMILDTCAAGAAALKFAQARDNEGDRIRAMDTLKDNTGLHLLMGSAADTSSYEASPYGHGLLTYALLQGMRGSALKNDNDVDVDMLFDYAVAQVPNLARAIGETQQPAPFAPLGTRSFDIGELLPGDRAEISLAPPKPVIGRPELLNGAELTDNLGLEELLRSDLRDETDLISRGNAPDPPAFFEDASDIPGAISVSGIYTVNSNQVTVKLRMDYAGKALPIKAVVGSASDVPGLARKLANTILAVATTVAPVPLTGALATSSSSQ